MAAVVTLHKAAVITERAHHKPDKDTHEVKCRRGVAPCRMFWMLAHDG